MQKSKLGISVALIGAALYFLGLFSGYFAIVLLAGYVLLMEENVWLKKTAVKSVALLMLFSLILSVVGLIPSLINFIDDIWNIIGRSFSIRFLTNIINMLRSGISLVQTVLFLILGLKALNQGTIPVPIIDKMVEKCFDSQG